MVRLTPYLWASSVSGGSLSPTVSCPDCISERISFDICEDSLSALTGIAGDIFLSCVSIWETLFRNCSLIIIARPFYLVYHKRRRELNVV